MSAASYMHLSLAPYFYDIGKQCNPRCDATEHHVPSEAILFAWRNFKKTSRNE